VTSGGSGVALRAPSGKAYFAAFGGRIWGPDERFEHCEIGGWGGGTKDPRSLTLRCAVDGVDEPLEIETQLEGRALPDWVTMHSAAFRGVLRDLQRPRLQFPLEFRIERRKTSIRLEGRATRVNLYTCSGTAAALVDAGGVTLGLLGPESAFDSLSLRRLTERELTALVRSHRARHRESSP
jgi:hypothetical protein